MQASTGQAWKKLTVFVSGRSNARVKTFWLKKADAVMTEQVFVSKQAVLVANKMEKLLNCCVERKWNTYLW